MNNQPFVSVLLPVYNSEKYLAEAIQSILDQSYQNFELLIIDDSSTDRSGEIAAAFEQADKRIRLLRHHSNQGLVAALNLGLDNARGDYIARMDADDISMPDRFQKQIEYMEVRPEIGILGCDVHYIDENGKLTNLPHFSFHGDLTIRWNLFFVNPFSHPTVMMRSSIIDRYKLRYDPSAEYVEDYEMWGRLLLVTKGENLPEILLYYRVHGENIGRTYGMLQNKLAAQVSEYTIKNHLPNLLATPQEIKDFAAKMWEMNSPEINLHVPLVPTYIKMWRAFLSVHYGEPGISVLRQRVIALAAFLSMYPLFQPGWIRTIWMITKIEWRWPFLLLMKLPLFVAKRYHLSIRLGFVVCAGDW